MTKITFEDVYATEYIRQSIDVLASRTLKKHPSLPCDKDDLQQMALIAINRAIPNYSPSKSSIKTYFRKVIVRRLVSEVRSHYRTKTPPPLSIEDVKPSAISQFANGDFQLSLNVKQVIETLPTNLQKVCHALLQGNSIREIIKASGRGAGRFYRHDLPMLKKAFAEIKN